jgi:hypothetical protein
MKIDDEGKSNAAYWYERAMKAEARLAALHSALLFAQGAIEDAILSEDGLDGDTGSRVLHIIEEAVTLGTFDNQPSHSLRRNSPESSVR